MMMVATATNTAETKPCHSHHPPSEATTMDVGGNESKKITPHSHHFPHAAVMDGSNCNDGNGGGNDDNSVNEPPHSHHPHPAYGNGQG